MIFKMFIFQKKEDKSEGFTLPYVFSSEMENQGYIVAHAVECAPN